jgi:hypothetical protein
MGYLELETGCGLPGAQHHPPDISDVLHVLLVLLLTQQQRKLQPTFSFIGKREFLLVRFIYLVSFSCLLPLTPLLCSSFESSPAHLYPPFRPSSMFASVERLYCKRPILCLASSKILTPHPPRRPLVRGDDTVAGWRGRWGVNFLEDPRHSSLPYICKYFVSALFLPAPLFSLVPASLSPLISL